MSRPLMITGHLVRVSPEVASIKTDGLYKLALESAAGRLGMLMPKSTDDIAIVYVFNDGGYDKLTVESRYVKPVFTPKPLTQEEWDNLESNS